MTLSDDIMRDIAEDVRRRIQHEIVADGLVYTQQLFNSWEIEKVNDGHYIVGSRLLWAKVMDDGRMPGKMPPVKALFPWVLDKFPDVHSYEEAWRVAWAVAKKIEKKGTEPRHYVKKALFSLEAETS